MPRPTRCRRICKEPLYGRFVPDGCKSEGEVVLSVDEYECIRLVDFEKLTHEECSRQMDISRTTVTELYESARYKIADSIVNGKNLMISGGNYRLCGGFASCINKCCKKNKESKNMEDIMRVAVTYENGDVFQHFGHTESFKIYDIENGSIVSERVVNTNGSGHGALAGFLMAADVDTLICGGIGGGAQMALREAGITFFGGVSGKADDAVKALVDGELEFNPDVRCNHHSHEHGEGHTCGSHGCGHHGCH